MYSYKLLYLIFYFSNYSILLVFFLWKKKGNLSSSIINLFALSILLLSLEKKMKKKEFGKELIIFINFNQILFILYA